MSIGGASITTGRVMVAVFSLLMFPAIYLMREEFPTPALAVSALIIAVHPYIVYPSQFYRNDALTATAILLGVALYIRYLNTEKSRYAIGTGVFFGMAMSSKELAFLIVPVVLNPAIIITHFRAKFSPEYADVDEDGTRRYGNSIIDASREYLPAKGLVYGILSGGMTVALFYGGWPSRPWIAPFQQIDAFTYWASDANVGTPDSSFNLEPILTQVPLFFALAGLGILGTVIRTDESWTRGMFVAWVVFSGFFLSLYTHQRLDLIIHIGTPMAILAGFGVNYMLIGLRSILDQFGSGSISANGSAVSILVSLVLVIGLSAGAVSAGTSSGHLAVHDRNPDHLRPGPYTDAREKALALNCSSVIVEDSRFPGEWYLRGTDPIRNNSWDAHYPAVVISPTKIDKLHNSSGNTSTESGK